MRWIVTGSGGQLGRCLCRAIDESESHTLVGHFSHAGFDIANREAVRSALQRFEAKSADVLVNAAALTDVDLCESQQTRARQVNGDGPAWLAEWCREREVGLVHISTDYVFDGDATRPYRESDRVRPATSYGRSKEEGERRVLATLPDAMIIRTSWLFGPGKNFIGAILKQARLRAAGEASGPLRVVSDQHGSPTYAADLADAIIDLVRFKDPAWRGRVGPHEGGGEIVSLSTESVPFGVFHLCNAGATTWFDFAREILDLTGNQALEVVPISSAETDRSAVRPHWSVLDCERAAEWGVRLRTWQEALVAFLGSSAGRRLMETSS